MEEQKKAVFDAGRQVEVQLRSVEGTKTVKVRFPTDEEWTERQRRRKIVIKQLGRGISETLAQRRQVRKKTSFAYFASLREMFGVGHSGSSNNSARRMWTTLFRRPALFG